LSEVRSEGHNVARFRTFFVMTSDFTLLHQVAVVRVAVAFLPDFEPDFARVGGRRKVRFVAKRGLAWHETFAA